MQILKHSSDFIFINWKKITVACTNVQTGCNIKSNQNVPLPVIPLKMAVKGCCDLDQEHHKKTLQTVDIGADLLCFGVVVSGTYDLVSHETKTVNEADFYKTEVSGLPKVFKWPLHSPDLNIAGTATYWARWPNKFPKQEELVNIYYQEQKCK